MKTFRVKKDAKFYHPTPIILLKGSTFKARDFEAIVFSINNLIQFDLKVAKEYFEVVET